MSPTRVQIPRTWGDRARATIGTARAGQDSTQEADTAISEVEVWVSGE